MNISNRVKICLAIYFLATSASYLIFQAADIANQFPYNLTVLHALLIAPIGLLLFLAVFPWMLSPGMQQKIFRDLSYPMSRKTKAAYLLGSLLLLGSPYSTFLEEANQLFWKQEIDRLEEMQDE